MGITRVFFNARCGGPDRFGIWELRTDQLQSKPLPQVWSCWQPSSGGIRYAKVDFVAEPLDYLGEVSLAHPTGDFHHVSMGFDSVGWPVFATNIGATGVRLDQHASELLIEEYQWEGTNPVLFNNYLIEPDVGNTDVICYYTKTGSDSNIYARFSRESYTGEYSLIDFPFKIEKLIRVEVESGYNQVLYGRSNHDREIKIYFSQYPEFPYFGNATESNTGTYGFYTGEHREVVILATGANDDAAEILESGYVSFAFTSGSYESIVVSGSGWASTSGFYESGSNSFEFYSGQYIQVIESGGGSNFETGVSGYSELGFSSGQYLEVVEYNTGVDVSSGTLSFDFLSGQYFED